MSEKVDVPQGTSDLPDWLAYIDSLHAQVIDMSLNRITAVGRELDVLKPASFVFLVGGTNGKGTTCHTLEKTLQLSGYKVGVFSSPHMINYTETVRIDGEELAGSEHVAAFVAINQARQDTTLTPFEFNTLGAFWLMKQAKVDVAIIEVGMGGRDDATNILEPDVSVITNVALDHEDWLGKDTEAIGHIKAGIFRAGKPAIIGQAAAPASLIEHAQTLGAVLYQRENHQRENHQRENHQRENQWQLTKGPQHWAFSDAAGDIADLPLPKMPLDNVATAIAALRASGLPFAESALRTVLREANLPGRFQIVNNNPTTILDVAHNPHAAAYLAERLREFPIKGRYLFVVGMLINKDIKSTVGHLAALSDQWYCCSIQAGPRSSQADDVARHLPQAQTFPDILSGWEAAKRDAKEDDVIVVCGSFYAVAPVLSALSAVEEYPAE